MKLKDGTVVDGQWLIQQNHILKKTLKEISVEFEISKSHVPNLFKKFGIVPIVHIDKIVKKREETCQKKYGCCNPTQNKNIRKATKNTCLERYGVENPAQSPEVKKKFLATLQKKYGVSHPRQINIPKEVLDKIQDREWLIDQHINQKKTLRQIGKELNLSGATIPHIFQKLNIPIQHYKSSSEERELIEFVKLIYEKEVVENCRWLYPPYEIDVYLPDKKLAIEYDGIFWHSFDKPETSAEKNYHLNKTTKCEQKGIQLLHIFSNEWTDPIKQQIWKSIIASKLGSYDQVIFARKCQVKSVNNFDTRTFLESNHLQGYGISKINLGLYYDDILVSLMTFGNPRFNKNYEWELVRFCNQMNTKVTGGASKLLKHFVRTNSPKSIISYADRRHSTGGLYDALGFTQVRKTKPNYFYTKKNNCVLLESRLKFQKHKLPNILSNFDSALTESQNMFNNDYRRIWDCGNLVYVLEY